MATIDNGVGEGIPDTWPVTLEFNSEDELIHCDAPIGDWPEHWLGKLTTAVASITGEVPIVRNEPQRLRQIGKPTLVYLDCGRWGGDGNPYKLQRNFGIIWGRWVVLCEFKGHSGSFPPSVDGGKLIDQFLCSLCTGNSSVHIIKKVYCRQGIFEEVAWQNLHLLLPDLHLPLVTRIPNRQQHMSQYGVYYSVDNGVPAWGRCLGRYAYRYTPGSAGTVDWFTQYFRGDIFGGSAGYPALAEHDMVNFLTLVGKCPIAERIHLVQLGDMYDLWIGLQPYFVACKEHKVKLVKGKDREGHTAEDFIRYWVERTNRENARVIDAFDSLKVAHKTWLYGNHDNYLSPWTCPKSIGKLPVRVREIRKHGLFLEHGHRADSSNRDGALGVLSGHEITQDVFSKPSIRNIDPNRRRLWTINAAISWVVNPNFFIYAMAHTHSPFLTELILDISIAKPKRREFEGGMKI